MSQEISLPTCHNCGNDVKPGQDECWTCLGETVPIEEITYWVYGTQNNLVNSTYPISINTTVFTINNNAAVFTWPATATASVTGLTYTIAGGTQSFNFAPINVVSGDTIQFTINGILKPSP